MRDDEAKNYMLWRKNHMPNESQLEEQRKYIFSNPVLISVVVPVYNTPVHFLREMIASVMAQTYLHWELCMADGCSTNPDVREIIKEASEKDSRVKYIFLEKNSGISVHTNESIKITSGEYIAFVDSDDTLTPDALYEIAKAVEDEPDVNFIYTDSQDYFVEVGGIGCRFKPDWNPVLLSKANYIIHLVVVRKSVVLSVGMLDTEFDVVQDMDFLYKVEDITNRIKHIPKVLYTWRIYGDSTSGIYQSNKEEFRNKMVISSRRNHLKRIGLTDMEADWYLSGKPEGVTVNISLITVFTGGINLLAEFLDSISFERKDFVFEVIVINMTGDILNASIEALKQGLLKVICAPSGIEPGSISAAYNYAAGIASGEYLAFANYCAKFTGDYFFDFLVPFTFYPGSALVTGLVEYKDHFNSVVQMGEYVGIGFPPEEIFIRKRRKPRSDFVGYLEPLMVLANNVTAVSDAFALIKKSIFEEAAGFDENFPRVFYMMDLSLRLNEMGYRHVSCGDARIVFQPQKHPLYAEWTEIFEEELELFYDRHFDAINNPERYINPNVV